MTARNLPAWARDVAIRMGAELEPVEPRRHERQALREALLEAAGRIPVSAMTLFERVRDDWGSINERALWRALHQLVERGAVVRIGAFGRPDGYVRGRARGEENVR